MQSTSKATSEGLAKSMEESLTCCICKQPLVEAATMKACLHSACRRCLLAHLKSEAKCPKCKQSIRGDVHSAYRSDRTLQDLVYKLTPALYWRQVKRRSRSLLNAGRGQLSERRKESAKCLLRLSSQLCTPREKISLALEYIPVGDLLPQSGPGGGGGCTPSLFKRYYRCEARTRLLDLRHLLEMKLGVRDDTGYALYFVDSKLGNLLDGEYTLQDLVYMFSWRRLEPLRLFFTVAKLASEEDKPPVLDAEEMPQLLNAVEPLADERADYGPDAMGGALQLPRHLVSLSTSAFEKNGQVDGQPPPPIITAYPPAAAKRKKAAQEKNGNNKAEGTLKKRKKNHVKSEDPGANEIGTHSADTDRAKMKRISKKKRGGVPPCETGHEEEVPKKLRTSPTDNTNGLTPPAADRMGCAATAPLNGSRMFSPPAIPPMLNARDAKNIMRAHLNNSHLLLSQQRSPPPGNGPRKSTSPTKNVRSEEPVESGDDKSRHHEARSEAESPSKKASLPSRPSESSPARPPSSSMVLTPPAANTSPINQSNHNAAALIATVSSS